MANFSVILLTAPPPGQTADGGAFVKVDGRECLLRSVELFLNRDNIKQILLVVGASQLEDAKKKYGAHLGFSGVKLLSGESWWQQANAGMDRLDAENERVIVHDAARPAVAFSDIDAIIEESEKHPAVVLAAQLRGELAELGGDGLPAAIRPALSFLQLLTPWAMKPEVLAAAIKHQMLPTGAQLTILRTAPQNIRVGSSADAGLAKNMLAMLPKRKMRASENPFEEAQW